MRGTTRTHVAAAVILGAGLLLRVATEVAYWPALRFYDSVGYLTMVHQGLFTDPDEPGGYPAMLRVIRLASHSLGLVSSLQHLAGLLRGALVYFVVWRVTRRRGLAALGCAVAVLGATEITLEQYVMADTFFTALIMGGYALLLLGYRRWMFILGGLLIAAACVTRSVGLFAAVPWGLYVIWRYRWSLTALLAVASVALPVIGYAATNAHETGHFGLTDDSAWLLYARVAPFGRCQGLSLPQDERVLCPHGDQVDRSVNFYLNSAAAPAVREFGRPSITAPPRVNQVLRGFALRVMEARPGQYLGAVTGSFLDFLAPGVPSEGYNENGSLILPRPGPWLWPYYHPTQRWPAAPMRAYARVLGTPRWLLAIFLICALIGLAWPLRRHVPDTLVNARPAVALTGGGAVALMLGSALAHFELRYGLPAVPLLCCAGPIGAARAYERVTSVRTPDRVASDRRADAVAGLDPMADGTVAT